MNLNVSHTEPGVLGTSPATDERVFVTFPENPSVAGILSGNTITCLYILATPWNKMMGPYDDYVDAEYFPWMLPAVLVLPAQRGRLRRHWFFLALLVELVPPAQHLQSGHVHVQQLRIPPSPASSHQKANKHIWHSSEQKIGIFFYLVGCWRFYHQYSTFLALQFFEPVVHALLIEPYKIAWLENYV